VKPTRYAWVVVGLLWFVWLLNYLDRQVIFSVFPPLQRELGLSNVQLGLLGTSFLWVYAVFSPFSGFLADRYGQKPLIAGSLFIWSLLTWVTSQVNGFPALLAVRAAMGLSEAAYLPAGLALIASYHGERTRSFATGLHYSGSYVGTVLGGVLGGWIAQHYGWRSVFGALGGVGVGYSLVILLGLRDAPGATVPSTQKPRFGPSVRELFALPAFPRLMTVFGAVSVGDWAVYTWMPVYLYERFHMSLAEAGFAATFYLRVGSVCGILLGGSLADWLSTRTPRGRLLTQVGGVLCGAPGLLVAGFAHSPIPILAALFLYGLGKGAYDCNGMPVLCQVARPQLRSTGFGLFNCAGNFAGGGIAAIGATLKDTVGVEVTFQIAGVVLLAAAILLYTIRLDTAKPKATDLVATNHL
jgi:predicted MFS family arabinose efflux permease